MTKFKLKIVTPSGIYQEVEVNQLNLRTTAGQVGILAHHMPLASGIEISERVISLINNVIYLPSVVDLYMLMMMKQK